MYTAGLLKTRVTFIPRGTQEDTDLGRSVSAGTAFDRWAAVDWTRGTRAMREGALDAYDTVMIRCNYSASINKECRIKIDGKFYHIDTLHADRQAGTIQITATEESA